MIRFQSYEKARVDKGIRLYITKPVLKEPETVAFNFCITANCIAVYGITIRSAGTLPLQNPY